MKYDEETIKQLKSYQFQIVASFFIIIAIAISITVIQDLYLQTSRGYSSSNINRRIIKKSRLSALILLIATFYFLYVTFTAYIKNKTKTNLVFLIATELGSIAVLMRYIAIQKGTVQNEGDII